MKPEIIKWVKNTNMRPTRGNHKNHNNAKEGRHTTSPRKYKEMETRNTGTTRGGNK